MGFCGPLLALALAGSCAQTYEVWCYVVCVALLFVENESGERCERSYLAAGLSSEPNSAFWVVVLLLNQASWSVAWDVV